MTLPFLIASAMLLAPQAPESGRSALAPELLVFHPKTSTGAEEQLLFEVLEAVEAGHGVTTHEDSEARALAGPEAGGDLRLQVYHAMRRAKAEGTWNLTLVRSEGIVMIEVFDDRRGLRVMGGTKIRSLTQERLSDEHLVRLDETISAVQHRLADLRARLAAEQGTPYRETIAWQDTEDPPHPGFRWEFGKEGSRVTQVYETSSIQRGGLQLGDLVLSINGMPVPSPPHFGRALGPLRAGDELKLSVLRGEQALELAGRVESSAELVPRWQAGVVGQVVSLFGATDSLSGESGSRKRLIVVFDPARPGTWSGVAVLRWIRDHDFESKLAIVGLAMHTDERTLSRFLDELKPGWPAIPDPDGRISDALRIHRAPAFLLVDEQGVLRFRQVDEAHLGQAIDTL
jgi:hypothetical protein